MRSTYRTHIRCRGTRDIHSVDYLTAEEYEFAFEYAAQYGELKKKYKELSFASSASPKLDNFGSRSSSPSDMVAMRAIKMADLSIQIDIIESTAREIVDNESIQKALLKSVGYRVAFGDIYPAPPVSKEQFYRYRRRYYYRLSKKINKDQER